MTDVIEVYLIEVRKANVCYRMIVFCAALE